MSFYSEHIFPKVFDFLVQRKALNALRSEVLGKVRGQCLEIGVGTGLNLQFYPESITEIFAVDPSHGMQKQLAHKMLNNRIKVNFTRAGAESLPYADQSFDTVLSTLTLCSIPELGRALKEIKRVLKPGGQFLFLDHGISPDKYIAKLQIFLNPVQHIVCCGCSLSINVEQEITNSGFNIVKLKKFYLPHSPKFTGYIYQGVAN